MCQDCERWSNLCAMAVDKVAKVIVVLLTEHFPRKELSL